MRAFTWTNKRKRGTIVSTKTNDGLASGGGGECFYFPRPGNLIEANEGNIWTRRPQISPPHPPPPPQDCDITNEVMPPGNKISGVKERPPTTSFLHYHFKRAETGVEVEGLTTETRHGYTDKKENQIFLIYKEIQNGAVAKSYMTNGLLIYGEIFAHFLIY
jgi:hypothetical protein